MKTVLLMGDDFVGQLKKICINSDVDITFC